MKTFTLKGVLGLFCSLSILFSLAQQTPVSYERCGTYQAMENAFSISPPSKALYEKDQARFQALYEKRIQDLQANRSFRTNAILTIPVVVHIVLPDPNLVTNAAVQSQLDILNADYAGLNADSTDIVAGFKPLFAKGNLRFCLAQRDPNGIPTNGIVRVTSGTQSNLDQDNDPVKFTTQGGSDAWPADKYLNLWVCVLSNNILGYSNFPGSSTPANSRGCVINYRSFGNVGSYLLPEYNNGRTATHEIGHFFNLHHNWGPTACGTASCADDDGVSDTPLQSTCHFGCPGTPGQVLTDGCSSNAPGIMYQNYMDYSDDRCMLLFTPLQNTRMETAITTYAFLTSLVNSNGCTPVPLVPNDASITTIVSPANGSTPCDPTTSLIISLANAGSNALTSAIITVQVNAATVQTFNWTGNLPSLATISVTLNSVNLNLGSNTITITASSPNGNPDSNPANNTATSTVNRGGGGTLPLVEGFSSAIFPPAGWTRINPDGAITWQQITPQGNTAPGTAFINLWSYPSVGQRDNLRTVNLGIGQADSLYIDFWVAHAQYRTTNDSLIVRVSLDCGNTFTRVYAKGSNTLKTTNAQTSIISPTGFFPVGGDWRKENIDISSLIGAGNFQVEFQSYNNFGDNIFIDDININKLIFPNRDVTVLRIDNPLPRVCNPLQKPIVTIKSLGTDRLTSVKINYQIDGGAVTTFNWTGNLTRNQTATITLADANLGAPGNHTIRVYTSEPNGLNDQNTANDVLIKAYTVFAVTTLPAPASIEEGFDNSTFPPAGWSIFNPDADVTWQWTPNYGKERLGAAWFDNYDNNTNHRFDDLSMPNYTYNGIDSIFLNFQLSTVTASYPGTTGIPIDTFSVLLSRDCGNTFTTVYKKWGEELQTISDPNFPHPERFFPTFDNQWRQDSINLGKFLGASEPYFQITFRFNGNFENNFFLDDVNLFTEILPARLKREGLLIVPNPFPNIFAVWHYRQPANLKYISVYNSAGQLVYKRQYNGNANTYIPIDLTGKAPGVYLVQLGYEDSNRNTSHRIIKY